MLHCGTSLLLQAVVELVVGEVLALDIAEEACDHRGASSQSSEMPTAMNRLSDPILPEKGHQVLPYTVTGAKSALQVGMVALLLEPFLS